MQPILDHPTIFLPLVVMLLFAGGQAGVWLQARHASAVDEASSSFKTLEGAVLGMLALLLGFSFAMAVSRYDLRKQLEVDEANAIGTTWLRTSALDPATRTASRTLLQQYVPVRLAFFSAGNSADALRNSLARTGAMQAELWSIATDHAREHRDPYSTLFVAALNDTIDLSEKRTAALENRIPGAAWVLLVFMASAANLLVGIGLNLRSRWLVWILPLIVGAALTLILDLDSPRSGFVRVHQNSMQRVAAQMDAAQP